MHYIGDASDNRNLAGAPHVLASVEEVEEIQGQTRHHSRSNTLLVMKTTYNEASTGNYDFSEREQERYDATSRDLKSVLITNQRTNTVLFFDKRCLACSQNAELRMLCNNVERNTHFHQESFLRCACCLELMGQAEPLIFILMVEVAGPYNDPNGSERKEHHRA